MKQSADDNFIFNENNRKFSKWVENTVGKGEIARHEQFLLFPQCFQKACYLVQIERNFFDDILKCNKNEKKEKKSAV